MSETQNYPIGNELKPEVIQRNLEDLFLFAHQHVVRDSAPNDSEGSPGDIFLVNLNGTGYLYAKFPTLGWKRVALS